jgi:hypothetical protein
MPAALEKPPKAIPESTNKGEQMSCVTLNVIDFAGAISGEVHGSVADSLIAALSAEPETINELELATARFIKPTDDCPLLSFLRSGENFEPYDAGLVIIDLAARIVMMDSTYSGLSPINEPDDIGDEASVSDDASGTDQKTEVDVRPVRRRRKVPETYGIRYHNGEHSTEVYLPYRIPDDWIFLSSEAEYKGAFQKRRDARAGLEWKDPRAVLFGSELCTYLIQELLAVDDLGAEGLFSEIHARWLTTARDDLAGRSPREVLLEKQEFIDFDLHSRSLQWSFMSECPPSLLLNSHAYRFAGFGTHEIVIYYDLVRLLLFACREHLHENRQLSLEHEAARLHHLMNAWLETANDEYQGKPPALIIEWERKRIPMAISGKEAMVDDDCPVCQAMAEDIEGPYFWHLDGSAMDDQFEFSFHKTKEEFEAERREWEEMSRRSHAEENMASGASAGGSA